MLAIYMGAFLLWLHSFVVSFVAAWSLVISMLVAHIAGIRVKHQHQLIELTGVHKS